MPRTEKNSNTTDENNWDYALTRTNKETGQVQSISFNSQVLYILRITDGEWKPRNA